MLPKLSIPRIIVIRGAIASLPTELVVSGACHLHLRKSLIPNQVSSIFKKFFLFLSRERYSSAHVCAGPIPRKLKKTFWNNYKIVVREFYSSKNIFFKNIKKIYSDNLKKQDLLIEEIKIITSKDEFEKERQNVISVQKQWKLIKPVPYKANEKNWKNFKNICDIYFQKVSQNRNLEHTKNKESEIKQDQLIEGLSEFDGDSIKLENVCKEYLSINKINSEKEKLFFEKIKNLLIKEGFKEEESQIKINEMKSKFMSIDQKKSQVYKLNSNLEKLKKDLIQQENNLLFFNDKSKENKLLEAVHLKIKNQKSEIEKLINQKKDLLN